MFAFLFFVSVENKASRLLYHQNNLDPQSESLTPIMGSKKHKKHKSERRDKYDGKLFHLCFRTTTAASSRVTMFLLNKKLFFFNFR